MSKHLFGLIVTPHGTAANNRGETPGNITTLQKILWNNEVHTTVSAEAIRWAMRWYWQNCKKPLNRRWNEELKPRHEWQDKDFQRWKEFIDDDVLGFMSAEAAKEETNDEETETEQKPKRRARGTATVRRGRLEITRAISLTPYAGDITFNAASVGATSSASKTGTDPVPYGTEVHATRYQYGFAITPEDLADKSRILDVVDAIVSLSEVAGNHSRFLYDFAPESVIFRWTDDFAPRILYGFSQIKEGSLSIPAIIRLVKAGDIAPMELIIGGPIATLEEVKNISGASIHAGVKSAANEVKTRIKKDLNLQ